MENKRLKELRDKPNRTQEENDELERLETEEREKGAGNQPAA